MEVQDNRATVMETRVRNLEDGRSSARGARHVISAGRERGRGVCRDLFRRRPLLHEMNSAARAAVRGPLPGLFDAYPVRLPRLAPLGFGRAGFFALCKSSITRLIGALLRRAAPRPLRAATLSRYSRAACYRRREVRCRRAWWSESADQATLALELNPLATHDPICQQAKISAFQHYAISFGGTFYGMVWHLAKPDTSNQATHKKDRCGGPSPYPETDCRPYEARDRPRKGLLVPK